MTTHKKNTASKLLKRFDNELRTLLLNDLNNVRGVKYQLLNSKQQARL